MSKKHLPNPKSNPASIQGRLRIIAGTHRSRVIEFRTDPRTRPMKDRTREAIFNLLGGKLNGYVALDLFAGSGILALESISRGATYAVAIEMLSQATREIHENAKRLQLDQALAVFTADSFAWAQNLADHIQQLNRRFSVESQLPWVVYICPPYKLWETDHAKMKQLLETYVKTAPAHSLVAVELDQSTDPTILPETIEWLVRPYAPALVAIGETQ